MVQRRRGRIGPSGKSKEPGVYLPESIKQPMIEGLYRIGWDAKKIITETGLPSRTVYKNIERGMEGGRVEE